MHAKYLRLLKQFSEILFYFETPVYTKVSALRSVTSIYGANKQVYLLRAIDEHYKALFSSDKDFH